MGGWGGNYRGPRTPCEPCMRVVWGRMYEHLEELAIKSAGSEDSFIHSVTEELAVLVATTMD